MNRDSVDKIITTYAYVLTMDKFSYKNKTYIPKPIRISPLILRDMSCPPNCGACCPVFSLDYLPIENLPDIPLQKRLVKLNNKQYQILSYMQKENKGTHCTQIMNEARCKIHPNQPFSCDFELIRFMTSKTIGKPHNILVKSFGHAHCLTRVSGQKGALCTIGNISEQGALESLRKMKRLKQWLDYFELNTKIDLVIDYIENAIVLLKGGNNEILCSFVERWDGFRHPFGLGL